MHYFIPKWESSKILTIHQHSSDPGEPRDHCVVLFQCEGILVKILISVSFLNCLYIKIFVLSYLSSNFGFYSCSWVKKCPSLMTHFSALTLCRCSISDSCDRVILTSFSKFSLNTSQFPVATISSTSSSVTFFSNTSSCRIMKCLQRSCLVSRPSLYWRITWK